MYRTYVCTRTDVCGCRVYRYARVARVERRLSAHTESAGLRANEEERRVGKRRKGGGRGNPRPSDHRHRDDQLLLSPLLLLHYSSASLSLDRTSERERETAARTHCESTRRGEKGARERAREQESACARTCRYAAGVFRVRAACVREEHGREGQGEEGRGREREERATERLK